MEKYTAPFFTGEAFHCPHCGVFAHQHWRTPRVQIWTRNRDVSDLSVSYCEKCKRYSLWVRNKIIFPVSSIAPLPTEDMPTNVKEDFIEARNIVNASPRAATALLRLALQKLMVHLGESGKNINDDIANLVKKGLSPTIQKALDAVRVVGNNAVHPGELDLKDDNETAVALFGLVNLIVNARITQPKEVDELYSKIPTGAKEAIEKRDNRL
jgi:hypothetical protein